MAPSTAYITGTLPIVMNGNTYNHQLAIGRQSDRELLKQRFHLDEFVSQSKDGNAGFVGLCLIGGAQSKFHNSARNGGGRIQKDGLHYICYNDAGLNTLADAFVENNDKSFSSASVMGSIIQSYYNYTTDYYIQWRAYINNFWSEWVTVRSSDTSVLAPNTGVDKLFNIGVVGESPDIDVQVRIFVTNEEGTMMGNTLEFTTTLKRIYLKRFENRYDAAHYNGALDSYFIRVPTLVTQQTIIYKSNTTNQSSVNEADNGWYACTPSNDYPMGNANNWYYIEGGIVKTQGTGDGVVVNPPSSTYYWANYSTSQNQACSLSGTGSASPTVTYRRNSNGLHYSDAACTVIAASGTYTALIDGTSSYYRILVTNGTMAANGFYCNGGGVAPIN
jgi:hypothetical protein